jgi:hypothetical protein
MISCYHPITRSVIPEHDRLPLGKALVVIGALAALAWAIVIALGLALWAVF